MNKIKIPKISIDTSDIEAVAKQMTSLPINKIETINWPDTYPSKPDVAFTIAHNSKNLLLQYRVKENEILAAVTADNGEVWTDSCVEMFISFDNKHYYNAEFTCIGKALLGYRVFGGHAEHAHTEVMQSIVRLPSLGTANREKEIGSFDWTLTLVIPSSAFWKSNITTFDGLQVKGNFFKCGDKLTVPHFVSWTTIDTPSPSFHQPQFFGELDFE